MYRWRQNAVSFLLDLRFPFICLAGFIGTHSVKVVGCATMIPRAEHFRNRQDAYERYRIEVARPPRSRMATGF